MDLPRPAVFGIIAAGIVAVSTLGYFLIQSNSSEISAGEERQRAQTTQEQYQKSMQAGGGPTIYTDPKASSAPVSTSTSAGGGPSIYK